MRPLKIACVVFLLIALTCGVVFAPQMISGQKEDDILKKSYNRQYYSKNGPDLTSEQVANFYYNHELSVRYNSSFTISEGEEADVIRDNLIDVIDLLFSESETVCDLFKDVLSSGYIGYFKNGRLIKVDNQPIALNFVGCSVKTERGKFEILYEEKTNTVIAFSCEGIEITFEYAKGIDACLKNTELTMRNYYQKYVGFDTENCYFFVDIPNALENAKNGRESMLHIHCGLMQYSDKGITQEDIVFF